MNPTRIYVNVNLYHSTSTANQMDTVEVVISAGTAPLLTNHLLATSSLSSIIIYIFLRIFVTAMMRLLLRAKIVYSGCGPQPAVFFALPLAM